MNSQGPIPDLREMEEELRLIVRYSTTNPAVQALHARMLDELAQHVNRVIREHQLQGSPAEAGLKKVQGQLQGVADRYRQHLAQREAAPDAATTAQAEGRIRSRSTLTVELPEPAGDLGPGSGQPQGLEEQIRLLARLCRQLSLRLQLNRLTPADFLVPPEQGRQRGGRDR